jgi:predicted SAM-dependent methyltransferase
MTLPPHQFGSTAENQTTARGLFLFELKSLVGRIIYRPRPATARYLHFGCGYNILPGFQNLDFYSFRERGKPVARHDLRFPLPYPDATFEGAYSEHCIEHLYPHQALQLMRELHRVLKPGGVLRVAVPDLGKYIDFYLGKSVDPEFSMFRSGCEAIWCLTQNWGHRSVWDRTMLTEKLREAGFKESHETSYRQGRNSDLLVDKEERRWETLYVEAIR